MPKRSRDGESDPEQKRTKPQDEQSTNQSMNLSINQPTKSKSTKSEPVSDDSDNDTQSINQSINEDPNKRHESLRKQQHQKSDKQRRAKIKEGMDQLKQLVSQHGKLESPDQASIVAASIDLVHSLRNEIVGLKSAIDAAHAHNAQQRMAIQSFQARMSSPLFNQPINQPTPYPAQSTFNDNLDATVVQRSNSLLNGGQISNAQMAHFASQIQQLRSFANNNNNNGNNQSTNQSTGTNTSNGQSNNGQSQTPSSQTLSQSLPPLSSQQMAQITAVLHSQISPSADLNTLLSTVAPHLAQAQQFMRGASQTTNNNQSSNQSINQQQHPQQQQASPDWD